MRERIMSKPIGENLVVSVRATSENPSLYDVFVTGADRYCLLQHLPHGTREEYVNGATFYEARELYDTIQTERDLNLIVGEVPASDYEKARFLNEEIQTSQSSRGGKSETRASIDLARTTENVEAQLAEFREVGSRYFSGWDSLYFD